MVKLALFLKATLEGVTEVGPKIEEEEEYYYSFQVQCSSCREIHPNHIQISQHERSEMSGSRGDANMVWKCKNCGRESSANLFSPVTPYTTSQQRQSILTFETRGCEFIGFRADGEWVCLGANEGKKKKTKFESVDLSEGEWYDYDDAVGAEVSITEVEWSVGRA